MQCAGDEAIGLIGSLYFIGYLIGAVLFPRLADLIGRRKIEIVGCFAQTAVVVAFLCFRSPTALYITLLLFGIKTPMSA